MRIKTKTEKYTFTFDKPTVELLARIVDFTEMSQIKIVTRAIEDYAKKKGVE